MSGALTKDSAEWLQDVARNFPRGAGSVAIMLALVYRNRDSWKAWPSVARLAAEVGMSRQGVQKTLRALEEAGYLRCEIGAGPNGQNLYTFHRGVQATVGTPPPTGVGTPPPTGVGTPPPTPVGSQRQFARQPELPDPPTVVSEGANSSWPDSSDEPFDEPSDESLSLKPSQRRGSEREEIDRLFGEFWQHYPRKVGKLAAETAFPKALKAAGSARTIIAGAMRYAAERDGQDPQFTKHPATWLRAGSWEDEPAEHSAGRMNGSVHRSAADFAELRAQAIDEGKWQ